MTFLFYFGMTVHHDNQKEKEGEKSQSVALMYSGEL
jgi:hypothetical protein